MPVRGWQEDLELAAQGDVCSREISRYGKKAGESWMEPAGGRLANLGRGPTPYLRPPAQGWHAEGGARLPSPVALQAHAACKAPWPMLAVQQQTLDMHRLVSWPVSVLYTGAPSEHTVMMRLKQEHAG